ncbi:helix-turn-helix domain-containing protein [Arthrobacter sulfonylureivorans]|uniref:Helix-turn-helix domain-containing protein n=1 Tax=Arthrobacter sulfonylureivorans TaxID=2486855 RepID=A0ABY3W6Z1_9MICC|nr:helix-turn-helix domain-containing protein [Arthrobacter sulfonylureivorans]UNK46077.1 helix-turn-helix domain-containing protein [Arthrobacter sulfonylureivorans]
MTINVAAATELEPLHNGAVSRMSTTNVAELSRVMSSYYGPVRAFPLGEEKFGVQMNTSRNNDVVVGAVRARGHRLERTEALIGDVDPTYMNFGLLLAGRGYVHQQGRTATLGPGAMFMNDPDVPYSLAFKESFHLLYFLFPRKMVGLSAWSLGGIVARAVQPDDVLSRFVRPFLTQFDRSFGAVEERAGTRLLHSALDLIGTVAHQVLESDADGQPISVQRQPLLQQAKDFIESNISDPELTPTRVAESLFITPRHLHGIFQPEGTTVAAWIRERRLEMCRRDLSDPHQMHKPVSAIGERWGFDEASHFSRVFRSAYGVSPRRYREQATA